MKITGLTKIGRNHYKVYTDGRAVPAFELYGSDLSPYDEDLKQWMMKLIQCFDGKAKANTDEEPRQ